ncbi:MAG: hypothetical protein JW982_05300 [Spirochaetes bacterium]|nr:hypothetical protein [Spirochaetota bacterium]
MSKIKNIFLLIFICQTILSAATDKIPDSAGGVVTFPKTNEIPGWGKVLSFDSIYRWGLSNSIYINRDSSPIVDNYAVYVHKNGSAIEFKDLKRYGPYYIFIDFVTYKGRSIGINSRLKIYVDGNFFDELTWNELQQISYYSKEIPREYYFDGIIRVEFREIDTVGGFWGIWDVALTDGTPPKAKEKKDYDFSPLIKKYVSEKTEKIKKISPESKENKDFKIKVPDGPVEPSAE